MINFKDFLTESRSAPLYHGTNTGNLNEIILQGQGIKPLTTHDPADLLMSSAKKNVITVTSDWGTPFKKVRGVSTSRNMTFARNYRGISLSSVIVLDQVALANHYRIVPVQYWTGGTARRSESIGISYRNEYEEFIITSKNIPVKYITGIIVPDLSFNSRMEKVVSQIRDTYGSSFIKTF